MCYNCGTSPGKISIYRNTECPTCGKDLKICLNCLFYDKNAHWGCRENISEEVRIKDRSNFCDYFRYSDSVDEKKSSDTNSKTDNAKSDFLKLFGDE